MLLSDYPNEYPGANVPELAGNLFQKHYLYPLGNNVKFVRLQSAFTVKY